MGNDIAGTRGGTAFLWWNVYNREGEWVDKVSFLPTLDAEYVRKSLIEHDGYDAGITVRKERK